jgi:hypothetical protein
LGIEVPDELKSKIKRVRWRWRALTLPNHGNECRVGYKDSAAAVYVSFRRGLRWYSLKYVWSPEAEKGAVCDQKRNPFVAQDTIVLRSGGPLGQWMTEDIDPAVEFRQHFADGDPNADVPRLMGLGLLTDGDGTHSESSADYADFEVLY